MDTSHGALIVVGGGTGIGKGTVAKIICQQAQALEISTACISTGSFFRYVSDYLLRTGLDEIVNDPATSRDKIVEIVMPILDPANWTIDEQMVLSFNGIEVHFDERRLMSNAVSMLIPKINGITPIINGLFDFENGLIGTLVQRSLGENKLVVYDTRFSKGEFPEEVLKKLSAENRLAIIEVIVSDEEALRILASFRAKSLFGREPTSEEINTILMKVVQRTNEDKSRGIAFPSDYVKSTFPANYTLIENDPRLGLDALREKLKPIVEKLQQNFL